MRWLFVVFVLVLVRGRASQELQELGVTDSLAELEQLLEVVVKVGVVGWQRQREVLEVVGERLQRMQDLGGSRGPVC